jgi:hypothetical protein
LKGLLLSDALSVLKDIPFCNTLLNLSLDFHTKPSTILHLSDGSFAVCIFND